MSRPARFSKLWSSLCLLVLAAVLIAGCGGGGGGSESSASGPAAQGGTLHVAQDAEVINIDPLVGTDLASINVISQINEPLFDVDAKGNPEPLLVSKVTKSPDQRVWTMQLRSGVKFSNGKPMTSADVLFTLEKARKSAFWAEILAGITSIKTPSPTTVVITTKQPTPELPGLLTQWSFGVVPANYGGVSEKEFAQHPIGTGPFVLGNWKHGESITLDRNPDYWQQGKPRLDKLVFQAVPSPESRVSQLKGGQLDVIFGPPWSQVSAIESSPELAFAQTPKGFVEFIVLNGRNALFQDPRVREAVDLAVDREGIVSATLGGKGEPAAAWIPPTVPASAAGVIKPTVRDAAKAKQLLSEAVKDGVDPSFTILTAPENPYWASAAQIVQQNLEEVGFDVKIQSVDGASQVELLREGNFDAGALEVYDATPSPAELLGYFNAEEGEYAGSDVTETTKLFNRAQSEVNDAKRTQLWHQMQEVIADEKYVLSLTYAPYPWAHKSDVAGFQVLSTGIPSFAETGFSK